MERTEKTYDQIERYLSGAMTDQERLKFEDELHKNRALQNEFVKHKTMHMSLKDVDFLAFRKRLADIENEISTATSWRQRVINLVKRNWRVAASIAILIGITALLVLQNQKAEVQLYDKYYVPFPIEDLTRTPSDRSYETKILNAYTEKNYEKAQSGLETLVVTYPDSLVYQLYLGNCYLNTGRTTEAINIFQNFNNNDAFYETALWYRALSHLKLNEIQAAKSLLNTLIDYDGIYGNEAKKLLEDLH